MVSEPQALLSSLCAGPKRLLLPSPAGFPGDGGLHPGVRALWPEGVLGRELRSVHGMGNAHCLPPQPCFLRTSKKGLLPSCPTPQERCTEAGGETEARVKRQMWRTLTLLGHLQTPQGLAKVPQLPFLSWCPL